jgi:hydroxypyruvate isomerase
MASFPSYSLAKRLADGLAKDLAKGSQVTALNPAQARDALAALERLTDFHRATGRRISLLAGISEFVEAAGKLHGRTMGEAVERYWRTIATVKRKDIAVAVEEFIQANEPLTRAADGQRAQLSGTYAYNRRIQLRKFAASFPSATVSELCKKHLEKFIGS